MVLLYGVAQIGGEQRLSILMLPSEWTLYIRQPWSLLTYAFVHTAWRHIAINIGTLTLTLLFASACRLTTKQILALFGIGSLAGGVLYLLIGDGILMGASAGIAALLPVVLYKVFKDQTALGLLFIAFVILFDSVTRHQLSEVTLGVHLIGYLIGILSLFFIEKSTGNELPDCDQLAHKVKVSGYASLSNEERNQLK